jgi:uncharacterized protein (TIGR02246 family)
MTAVLSRFTVLLLVALSAACAQTPPEPAPAPDTRAADEAAIRAASEQWAEAAKGTDPAKFTSYYTSDALLMFDGMPVVSGKAAIDPLAADMMKDPSFALTFTTTKVEVARSGDLAYELGTWQMTSTDPASKKPATTKGDFVTVWKKQADGSWKCAVDVPVAGPPEMPAGRQ